LITRRVQDNRPSQVPGDGQPWLPAANWPTRRLRRRPDDRHL